MWVQRRRKDQTISNFGQDISERSTAVGRGVSAMYSQCKLRYSSCQQAHSVSLESHTSAAPAIVEFASLPQAPSTSGCNFTLYFRKIQL